MVKTSEVFTPNKMPTFTSVKRSKLWDSLDMYAEQGGAFVSVLGTTKLGKSTLVKSVMTEAAFHSYIPGQTLADGASALWARLASDLELPVSKTTGMVTGDKSKWGFIGRFGIKTPVVSAGAAASVGGEHHKDLSKGATYEMDAPSAVTQALATLAADARAKSENPPIIVIDDFHFVTDPAKRRELVLALRPITESDITVILATLPGREADEGFEGTNVGGRHYPVIVPRWDDQELTKIALTGFKTLKVVASDALIAKLVDQSYGSPQIMQQLCFNLCRIVNGVKDDDSGVGQLSEPDDWEEFFRKIQDPHSIAWLKKLGLGLTQRRPRTSKADLPDGRSLDGYQLILWALHSMGSPDEVSFNDVRSRINDLKGVKKLGVAKFALEQKAKNMNAVASRDMTQALAHQPNANGDEEDDVSVDTALFTEEEVGLATMVPQPVFEVAGDKAANMRIRILDPLLAYTLTWHPEAAFER